MNNISFVVAAINLRVTVITSLVVKITVAEITSKVAVITSFLQWPRYLFCGDKDPFLVAAIS